jgi:DNA mismatch repair protein MutL
MPGAELAEAALAQGGPARVRLLDPHTVNQIAAGEVVERPAAVVKELVENALDAGARRVEVVLEGSGTGLVAVEDDGHGMDAETLAAALGRHATSKIQTAEDLGRIATYGFRGEALPSIASVSRWALESGVGAGPRWRLEGEGGEVGAPRPVPGPAGTRAEVGQLFFNTPARLKFLRSPATELAQCVEAVARLAVARPEVRFRVAHDGREALFAPGTGRLEDAVAAAASPEAAAALVPVDGFNGSARVRGLVSPPHFTKPTRSAQWLSVNGRPCRSRTLLAALDAAYRSLTPERRYPLAYLDVLVDPAELDVNVSPTKSEVKFRDERGVFDAVRRSVAEALLAHGMVPTVEAIELADRAVAAASPLPGLGGGGARWSGPPASAAPWHALVAAQAPVPPGAGGRPAAPSPAPAEDAETGVPEFLRGLRVIGQLDATFILAENWQGLLVVDQHVAHERVLYEWLLASRGAGAVESQRLLEPEPLHLDARTAPALAERLADLAAIGFELEPFGGESFLVRSVPALWRGQRPAGLLRDIADAVADGERGPLRQARDDVYVMCSCKMAVKAGDPLSLPEMERLLHDLGHTENPYLCPHGRPITVVMPRPGLYRKFGREAGA